jgi:hypothetical protein
VRNGIFVLVAFAAVGLSSCREVGREATPEPNPIRITSVDVQGSIVDRPGSAVRIDDPGGGVPTTGPSPLAFSFTLDTTGTSAVNLAAFDDASPPNQRAASLTIE